MAKNTKNEATYILDSKKGLPNKLLQADGSVTDMLGNTVVNGDKSWEAKQALPNKFLNPDGTYSTLNEILSGAIDTDIFVIVDELPATGDEQKIYLVPDSKGGFVEYHWTGSSWDAIGILDIDLSDYSTTQEMMNAIEAACLTSLNSAKAYTDAQIAGIPISSPDVFYLSKNPTGTSNSWSANAIAELQAIRDTGSTQPCIIIAHGSGTGDYVYFSSTHLISGSIIFNMIKPVYEDTQPSYGYSVTRAAQLTVNITVDNSGTITNVSSSYFNGAKSNFIDPTVNYTNTFNPTQPYHPATKKYVDDAITDNIATVLNESY